MAKKSNQFLTKSKFFEEFVLVLDYPLFHDKLWLSLSTCFDPNKQFFSA